MGGARLPGVDPDDELSIPAIAAMLGLNDSSPRAWVTSKRLPAHRDEHDRRRWLVYRRDLDAFLKSAPRSDIGRPKGRGAIESTDREDWSDAPEQATLDLTSSLELPGSRR